MTPNQFLFNFVILFVHQSIWLPSFDTHLLWHIVRCEVASLRNTPYMRNYEPLYKLHMCSDMPYKQNIGLTVAVQNIHQDIHPHTDRVDRTYLAHI